MKDKAIGYFKIGGVAQMVERSLSMREVPGSIPGASITIFFFGLKHSFYRHNLLANELTQPKARDFLLKMQLRKCCNANKKLMVMPQLLSLSEAT